MNFEKSFSYPFEDQEVGTKLGLGAALSLVPILNFVWSGYMIGIIRNVMNDAPKPLPRWDDLGKLFMDGLIVFVAGLIYAAPMLLLLGLPLGMTIFSGILSGNSDTQELARVLGDTGGVLFLGLFCLFGIYGLALSIIYPAILILFAREGTFASCFKLREAFELIRRNSGLFFTAWGVSLLLNLGGSLVNAFVNLILNFVPCLGWILGIGFSIILFVYIMVVYAHLFGQFAREAFGQTQLAPVG